MGTSTNFIIMSALILVCLFQLYQGIEMSKKWKHTRISLWMLAHSFIMTVLYLKIKERMVGDPVEILDNLRDFCFLACGLALAFIFPRKSEA